MHHNKLAKRAMQTDDQILAKTNQFEQLAKEGIWSKVKLVQLDKECIKCWCT
jgi:hypothetical protein